MTNMLDVVILDVDVFKMEVVMRVKKEHLRKRGKITLYVPPEDVPFIESLISRYPHISFSRLVINTLREKFGKKGVLTSIGGSLRRYSQMGNENMEQVIQEVAINAAKEGLNS